MVESSIDQEANGRCWGVWRCLKCAAAAETFFTDLASSGIPICDNGTCHNEGGDMVLVDVKVNDFHKGESPLPRKKINNMASYFKAIAALEDRRDELIKGLTGELMACDLTGNTSTDIVRAVIRGYNEQIVLLRKSLVNKYGLIDA